MKKPILLFAFLLMCLGATAQTVNDVPIRDLDAQYIEIVGTGIEFSNKINVYIDFGQHAKFFTTAKQTLLKDENGKKVEFNSIIDALNYMYRYGFEFVQVYDVRSGDNTSYHYILRRIKKE